MKNEVIFEYYRQWRGRYDDHYSKQITFFADFSDITKWPYQIMVKETEEDGYDGKNDTESVTCHRISKNLFDNIKKTIERHMEIASLPDDFYDVGNYYMVTDGCEEFITFNCTAFQKKIHGDSILDMGQSELEDDQLSKQYCAILYRVYRDIKNLVETEYKGILRD